MSQLTIVMAQLNLLVGDIPGNTQKVIDAAKRADQEFAADVVVFSELTLMGYPPEDLVLRPSVAKRIDQALHTLFMADIKPTLVVGYPKVVGKHVYNMAGVIAGGKLIAEYAKQCLPNYRVFDDKRYFTPGSETCVVDLGGIPTAILICEDIWESQPIDNARDVGARLALILNGSPYHVEQQQIRADLLTQRAQRSAMPLVYVNQVGGQDELIFDGGSSVVNAGGELTYQAPFFQETLVPITVERLSDGVSIRSVPDVPVPKLSRVETIYQALVLGVRDYVGKNRFPGIVLGLSGGIDSALVLTIAVDALGSERVEAVMMPFRYTSQMSRDDAAEEAKRLGVLYRTIGIEPMYDAFMAALTNEFAGLSPDKTEENIQARCRGNLLMAISNKKGYLVLTTGNKSELAVGYATLYGDMAGGFDVLKDVPKTLVYELANYRNTVGSVIPHNIIERPPSAELAPGQKDEDSLPPYPILDQILEAYIEHDDSAEEIIRRGFDRAMVEKVVRMVDLNEYKRRQAAIGPRITQRGFGRDRRYPITSGWKLGE